MGTWPKKCRCGRTWWPTRWSALPFVGTMGYGTRQLELRDCTCGSSISVRRSQTMRSIVALYDAADVQCANAAVLCERARVAREQARSARLR